MKINLKLNEQKYLVIGYGISLFLIATGITAFLFGTTQGVWQLNPALQAFGGLLVTGLGGFLFLQVNNLNKKKPTFEIVSGSLLFALSCIPSLAYAVGLFQWIGLLITGQNDVPIMIQTIAFGITAFVGLYTSLKRNRYQTASR